MTVDSLGNLALREIAREWDCVNRDLFGGAMRRPSFLFLSGTRRLGQWNGVERSIALNRSLLDDQSWGVVLEVLRHEMAHQFVFEVMGVRIVHLISRKWTVS